MICRVTCLDLEFGLVCLKENREHGMVLQKVRRIMGNAQNSLMVKKFEISGKEIGENIRRSMAPRRMDLIMAGMLTVVGECL
jgi:hypothetical protein